MTITLTLTYRLSVPGEMTYARSKAQVQRSRDSRNRVKTTEMKEQMDGRTLPIVLPSRLTRSITGVSLEYRDAVTKSWAAF